MKKNKCFLAMVPYLRPDYPPLSLPILKGCLESIGIETNIRDFNVDVAHFFGKKLEKLEKFCSDDSYYDKDIIKQIRKFYRWQIKHHIARFDPDIVGISLFSFFMQRTAELFCLELKNYKPDLKIFMGGSGVTRFLNRASKKNQVGLDDWPSKIVDMDIADAVIIGEGEQAIIDFCKDEKKDIIVVPQLKDLKLLSKTTFNGIDVSEYENSLDDDFTKPGPVLPITGSRGCVRKCSFCNVESIWPKFVFRTAEDIVDEMQHYVDTLGVCKFKFTDSLVNGSTQNWRQLNETIVARKLDIEYTGQFIAKPMGQTLDRDYELAKKAGATTLKIGIESGSERVRHHMKKKFDNESLYHMIDNLLKNKIRQRWLFITGYPTETEEDFQQTLDLMQRYSDNPADISINLVSFLLLSDSPIAWQGGYKDLKFTNGHPKNESMENFWICKSNPTLDFDERTKRYQKATSLATEIGFINNPDSYKKRITSNEQQKDNQIHS